MNEDELYSTSPKKGSSSAVINSKCSCPECDSIDCFIARNTKVPCSCIKCQNSKTCFYYSKKVNMNEKKSKINMARKNNSLVNPKMKIKKEHVENEVIYDCNKNTKSGSVSIKQSEYSDTATRRKSDLHCETQKVERPNTQVHKASIKFLQSNHIPTAAGLSAQVMNVPYTEFKNSLSVNKSDNSYKRKITKYDILARIKEAYKACSCKVCECVIGKSNTRNEFCKCKPCDCNDCTSLLSKFHSQNDRMPFLPIDGCPCIRCTRTQCKGIVNKFNEPQICDCEPCDCIKCADSFNKLCNCKPCQCIECKAMSVHLPTTFIVAPVTEDYQRNVCLCSPCECIECGHGYAISSNMMHEMSTGINSPSFCHCETCVNEACEPEGSDSCKCHRRNKIVMKPLEKDDHDYDIRTISTKKYTRRYDKINTTSRSDNDTIAMFATLPDQYPTKYDNIKTCFNCDNCDCFVDNEDAVNSIKSSKLFKATNIPYLNYEACNSSPYQSQFHFDSTIDKETSYKFNACDFLNFESLTKISTRNKYSSVKLINKLSSKRICSNKSGTCIRCRKLRNAPGDALGLQYGNDGRLSYSSEDIYPIKRAKLLTPSILNGIEFDNMDNNTESHSKIENDIQSHTIFNSDINDLSYNYNITTLSQSNSNYNKKNNFYLSINNDVSLQENTIENKAHSQGIVNDKYLDRNITKNIIYKLSEGNDDIAKTRSHGIILSDPQFNLNRNRYEEAKHIFNYAFKNKAHSMFDRGQLVNACIRNNIDFLNSRVSYERAQKTLRDSKIYSLYLLNILDKYEKANTEFYSISQKLKVSHDLLMGDSLKCMFVSLIESKINNNKEVVTDKIEYAIKGQGIRIIDEPKDLKLEGLTKQMDKSRIAMKTNFEPVKIEKEDDIKLPTKAIDIANIKSQKAINVSSTHDLKRQDNNSEPNSYNESPTTKCCPNYIYLHSLRKKPGRATRYKCNYSKLLRRTIILSKKITLARKRKIRTRECTISESTKHISSQTVNNFNYFINKENTAVNKPIPCNMEKTEDSNESGKINLMNIASTKIPVSTTCIKIEEWRKSEGSKIIGSIKQTKDQDIKLFNSEKSWPTFRKNLCLEPTFFSEDKGIRPPSLDVGVKQALHAVSLQINNTTIPSSSCENKALSNLSPEIKDLTKSKKIHSIDKENIAEQGMCIDNSTKTDSRMPIINSTKGSRDALKVNTLCLRRISDHTVLVKWKVPCNTADIEGYELQVDGRAVRKILSPKLNVAVVTCLPHYDKVLLTIRTITSAVVRTDNFPSVTVIYHPRKK